LDIKSEDIDFYSGILPGEINTSKLGYTLGTTINWIVADNNSIIKSPEPRYSIFINGSQITDYESFGITRINPSNSQDWTVNFMINFDPKYGYQRGTYVFKIGFSEIGLESKNIEFNIFIKDFDIKIDIIYDKTFTQGESYPITVILTYVNITDTPLNATLAISNGYYDQAYLTLKGKYSVTQTYKFSNYLGFNQEGGLGDAVQNKMVTFEITVVFENGTTKTLVYQELTDSTGKAIYLLPADQTINIMEFKSIGVWFDSEDFSEIRKFTIDIGNQILVKIRENQDDIILSLTIIIIILLISIIGFYVYKKSRKKTSRRKDEKKEQTTQVIKITTSLIEQSQDEVEIEKKESLMNSKMRKR
jgi:hypothetical protein